MALISSVVPPLHLLISSQIYSCAVRPCAAHAGRRRISKTSVGKHIELSPRLGTATTYRPAIVADLAVESSVKAELRTPPSSAGAGKGAYNAPRHGWPATSRQQLRGSFETPRSSYSRLDI
jgi:hypothetical protein